MKRTLRFVWAVLSSRVAAPAIIAVFLLVYIGIAFFTDETLITLMKLTRTNMLLMGLLAMLPLSSASRLVAESITWQRRRRALTGRQKEIGPGLFDESVELSEASSLEMLQRYFKGEGYATRCTGCSLGVWRGIGIFPARLLFMAAVFCLYAGIMISLTGRTAERVPIVEGEPFALSTGENGFVERIALEESQGLILAKKLLVDVSAAPGQRRSVYGLYPPSLHQGAFVYPRYIGIGLSLGFNAPDMATGYETFSILNIYRRGKEATAIIPGTPYRMIFSLAGTGDETDPLAGGNVSFNFKLLKGNDVVMTGSVPRGGSFVRDGYRIVIVDAKRVVITDFIRDYGVLLIWAAGVLFLLSFCSWLPVRLFSSRGEMLFRVEAGGAVAFFRAEGRRRRHEGVFHEALDLLEAGRMKERQVEGK